MHAFCTHVLRNESANLVDPLKDAHFADNRKFLRAAVEEAANEAAPIGAIPHYKDLEWRIQV